MFIQIQYLTLFDTFVRTRSVSTQGQRATGSLAWTPLGDMRKADRVCTGIIDRLFSGAPRGLISGEHGAIESNITLVTPKNLAS